MANEQSTVEYRNHPIFSGYRVGDDGTVWSCKRFGEWRQIKPQLCRKTGYYRVALSHNGKAKSKQVHTLVLETFVGPPDPGQECCHGRGGPLDNRLYNLRWGTRRENSADSVEFGNHQYGEGTNTTDLKAQDVERIFSLRADGKSHKEISELIGVNVKSISPILKGKRWVMFRPDDETSERIKKIKCVRVYESVSGSKNPNAKLTVEQVLEIRRLYDSGENAAVIADIFSISRTHVYWIGTRKSWKNC